MKIHPKFSDDRVVSRRAVDQLKMAGIVDADNRVTTSTPLDDADCTHAHTETAKKGNLQSEDLAENHKDHEIMRAQEH